MRDKPITNIMRPMTFVTLDASVGRALEYMRAAGTAMLPVVNFGKLAGVIREKDLLDEVNRSSNPESVLEMSVRSLMHDSATVVRPWTNIGEAAEVMGRNDAQIAFVVNEYGDYLGAVSRIDVLSALCNTLKPASIAGMATPLGVYLTTGSLRSGPGDLGLFLAGVSLMLMNVVAIGVVFGIAWIARYFGYLDLWSIMMSSQDLSGWAEAVRTAMYGLALLIFLVLLRISPVAGYHAAEHQVVHTIENGDPLTPEYVVLHPRAHPRCGTNIVAAVIIFTMLSAMVGTDIAILLTIVVLMIGWRRIGDLLQNYVTTKPASTKQILSGIRAGEDLLAQFRANPSYNIKGWTRIWYTGMIQMMAGVAAVIGLVELIQKLIS